MPVTSPPEDTVAIVGSFPPNVAVMTTIVLPSLKCAVTVIACVSPTPSMISGGDAVIEVSTGVIPTVTGNTAVKPPKFPLTCPVPPGGKPST